MRSISRLLLNLGMIGVVFGWFVSPTPAFACTCAEATPTEQFDNATAVFIGTVKSISEGGMEVFADFDVSEVRKGSVTENVTVNTSRGAGVCGFDFDVGKEYIVYTYGDDQPSTSICSGTSLRVDEVQNDANDGDIANDPETSNATTFIIVAIVFFIAGVSTVYLVGRKRNI